MQMIFVGKKKRGNNRTPAYDITSGKKVNMSKHPTGKVGNLEEE